MSQDQLTLFLHLFIRDSSMSPISKDHAVLKNFHNSSTLMTHTSLDNFCTQIDIHIQRTSEKFPLRTDYQLSRVKRGLNCSVRRSFSFRTQFRGWRILSFRQPVNLIIEHQSGNINITANSMNKMVTTNSQSVTVTGNLKNIQFRIGTLSSGCNSSSPAMNRMKTISIHVIGETGRTSNSGNYCPRLFRVPQFSHGLLYGVNDTMVTATRTPTNLLVALKIFRCILFCHDYFPNNSVIFSFSSTTVKGNPATLLY